MLGLGLAAVAWLALSAAAPGGTAAAASSPGVTQSAAPGAGSGDGESVLPTPKPIASATLTSAPPRRFRRPNDPPRLQVK